MAIVQGYKYDGHNEVPLTMGNVDKLLLDTYKKTAGDTLEIRDFDGITVLDDYDATGGYQYAKKDADKVRVYTKYLTGKTEDDADSVSVAHGVNLANILSVQVIVDNNVGVDGTNVVSVVNGATNIVITYNASHRDEDYVIKVDYTV